MEGGDVVASFDVDSLNDYRARRPVLDVVDGVLARMQWPTSCCGTSRSEGGTCSSCRAGAGLQVEAARGRRPRARLRLGGRADQPGAIPAAVPHTRPVPVLANASSDAALRNGEQQGPGGILRARRRALRRDDVAGAGIPAVGYYAQVLHYIGVAVRAGDASRCSSISSAVSCRSRSGAWGTTR